MDSKKRFNFNSKSLVQAHFVWMALKMGKSHTKRYLHISYKQIITYMCYTSVIIGWQRFNCISLLGVMSMQYLNENNKLTTTEEMVNLSLAPMKSSGNQQESFSSVSPISLVPTKSDFATPNADNTPIQGWECYCWNTTTGYEVKFNSKMP